MLEPDEYIRFCADLDWVYANRTNLSDKELEFVIDLRQQVKEYGNWIRVSEKQRQWLAALERRVSGEDDEGCDD